MSYPPQVKNHQEKRPNTVKLSTGHSQRHFHVFSNQGDHESNGGDYLA